MGGGAQSPDAFPAWTGAAPAGFPEQPEQEGRNNGQPAAAGGLVPEAGWSRLWEPGKEDAAQTSKINTGCQDPSQTP